MNRDKECAVLGEGVGMRIEGLTCIQRVFSGDVPRRRQDHSLGKVEEKKRALDSNEFV